MMTNQPSEKHIHEAYAQAQERYAAVGVNTDLALATLEQTAISLHCWQGDDVAGFEDTGGELGGGLATTGNYPGKARNADELRRDLDEAYSLIPGTHRVNLHAMYPRPAGARSSATSFDRSIFPHGSTEPEQTGTASILTLRAFRIQRRRAALP